MTSKSHENLPPEGYVQALPTVTHDDHIADGVKTIRLSRDSYPAIIRAMNLIREDNGGPSWPPEQTPRVAERWQPLLPDIEQALAALSDSGPAPEDEEAITRIKGGEPFCYLDSELYTFCNGEQSVVDAIKARSDSLRMANDFLNDFFEGWTA